ncbi:cell differentiation protein RCD1 [Artemisia annua]|uniref:Cell differentiation protein RCD1 n=1 Tax=Artemisia annua TaxID=35608 RepID=A0A2U1N179_ARTAN|nr:cell differentiation protein RCD1 [Artemisia annua]
MANVPPPNVAGSNGNNEKKMNRIEQLVLNINNPNLREKALLELSKNMGRYKNSAVCVWDSFGTITIFIQEILSVYPFLSPPTLTTEKSNRACHTLAILQSVASHPETKMRFLNAQIHLYLYPILNVTDMAQPFEYLRLSSFGVIGALVKVNDTEIINALLPTELIPLCLRTMEMGSELTKCVATFIIQRILSDAGGLNFMCRTAERFVETSRVLRSMVTAQPTSGLLKHIIRCYLLFTQNSRACDALKGSLPNALRDGTFSTILSEDQTTSGWLQQLLLNLQGPIY